MRILLVSQMYPGPADPDLGTFVAQTERRSCARGHEVERAVLDTRAGGKLRYLTLARRTWRARSTHPDVVYAHFLVPSGLIAALGSRAPLVVTAHGRDVRNVGALRGVAAATRFVVRRAAAVVCVSEYLRRELETKVPEARGKTEVVSSGVDLERFRVAPPPDGPPRYLCVGALTERKNVVRLADAFARLGRDADLRGRRAAAGGARGPRRRPARGPRPARGGRAPARRQPRALPAEPDRAARPGAARGDGLRPLRRRHAHRRPAGVRAARGRDPRRPARRGRDRGGDARRRRPCRARTGRRARPRRRTTSPARRSASRRSSAGRRRRSASLISTSGRTASSSPASRASASACSQLSRAFSGSTPCLSRLSPVTSSFRIRSRASEPSTGRAYPRSLPCGA